MSVSFSFAGMVSHGNDIHPVIGVDIDVSMVHNWGMTMNQLPAIGDTVTFRMWDRADDVRTGTVESFYGDGDHEHVVVKRPGYRETYAVSVARFIAWRVA